MARSQVRAGPRGSPWGRLPLGAKILLPTFTITLLVALGSAIFFTFQQVDQDRVARDGEGRTVAIVVQGTLQDNSLAQDPSHLIDLLSHINLAYPDVAAICVLAANPADPLGPLVVFAASETLAKCQPDSSLTPGVGVGGIRSGPRDTAAGRMEETVSGAGLNNAGRSAVVQVLVPITPFATLALSTLSKSATAGLVLALVQTGIVYLVLWFSALRPLKRLRLAALAAAHAAQPSIGESAPSAPASGDEIDELSMRFHEMLAAVRDRERQVIESHDQLETLISNAPVIVFSSDGQGKMLHIQGSGTESLHKRLGHDRLTDASLLEIAGPNTEFAALLRRASAGEKVHDVVPLIQWLTKADPAEPIFLDVILNPNFDSAGRFAGMTGLAVNVTDRVNAATARAESEKKSAFLAAMSHELRTPLNSIMGFSQLLDMPGQSPALSGKQKRYISHILSSGSHLLALIGDILDVAKSGAGQQAVALEPVTLLDLVVDPVDRTKAFATEKNIAVDVFLPPELVAYTDAVRVRQMLFNLISNAIKFTPNNGPRVLVSGRAARGGVEISVADSGIGIAPEDHEKVFDEFTQVDRGPSRTLDGTGLGLTLTRRLAALVGGSVRVESALGVGSTFTIWLPGMAAQREAAELAAAGIPA